MQLCPICNFKLGDYSSVAHGLGAGLYMWTTLQSGKVKTVQGSDPKAARGALTEWQSCATHAFLDVSKIFTDELFEASSRSFP
eukprot:5294941-Amphidinium_carterae.1